MTFEFITDGKGMDRIWCHGAEDDTYETAPAPKIGSYIIIDHRRFKVRGYEPVAVIAIYPPPPPSYLAIVEEMFD